MGKELRIAFIEPVGGHGGMDYYDLGLCRGLVDAGASVSWYTCVETPAPSVAGLRFAPVYRGIWGKAGRAWRALNYARGTLLAVWLATMRGEQTCHLHFFHGAPEELFLLLCTRLFRRRVVLTIHDVESFSNGSPAGIVRRFYQTADRVIVHNLTSKQEVLKTLRVLPAKVSIIPHGNYTTDGNNAMSMGAAREALGLSRYAKIVLFFGQIKEVKGLDLLLDAVQRAATNVQELTLVVAGRPWKADFARYQQQIDKLGIADRCHLHIRFIPDDEVASFYAAADIVALPYRRIYQSGVLLMAMSHARAVIVSNLPGMMDIVSPNENGFVFQSGSVASLAKALEQALNDNAAREAIACKARRYVEEHHDWSRIARSTLEVYSGL